MTHTVKHSLYSRLVNRSKDLLFIAPLLPMWRRRLAGKAMVYLYHRVEEEGQKPFLDAGGSPVISPDEFRRDIRSLKKMGAQFVRFSELPNCDFKSDAFYVVLCADDGFYSNYDQAMDICDQESVPQTLFQCAAMLSGQPMLWEHQLYLLFFHPEYGDHFRAQVSSKTNWPNICSAIRESVHPNKITDFIASFVSTRSDLLEEMQNLSHTLYPQHEHLQQAQRNGHEIASHGDQHWPRSLISENEFFQELLNSRKKLDDILDSPVKAFSYPFNDYHEGDAALCSKVFELVATVDGGAVDSRTPLKKIPRNTFPGTAKNKLRRRRWLYTGHI